MKPASVGAPGAANHEFSEVIKLSVGHTVQIGNTVVGHNIGEGDIFFQNDKTRKNFAFPVDQLDDVITSLERIKATIQIYPDVAVGLQEIFESAPAEDEASNG